MCLGVDPLRLRGRRPPARSGSHLCQPEISKQKTPGVTWSHGGGVKRPLTSVDVTGAPPTSMKHRLLVVCPPCASTLPAQRCCTTPGTAMKPLPRLGQSVRRACGCVWSWGDTQLMGFWSMFLLRAGGLPISTHLPGPSKGCPVWKPIGSVG